MLVKGATVKYGHDIQKIVCVLMIRKNWEIKQKSIGLGTPITENEYFMN